jgi:hypothetical protein
MQSRLMTVIAGIVALPFGSVPVLQAGSAPNLLNISASVVQFNPTGVGSTSTLDFTPSIYNPGTAPVTITGFSITGALSADFSVNSGSCPISPNTLLPGYFCYPNLSFTPSAAGLRVANMVVKDVGGAPQTVVLTGEGLAATKAVTFSVPEVTFPSVPIGLPAQNAPTAFVQAQNTGTASVNVQSVGIVGPNSQDFQIVSNSCSTSIPAGGLCYLTLSFLPTATGLRSANLQFVDDAPGGVQSLPLVGAGSPAVNMLQFFPTAVAFTPTGTANSEPAQITVQNTGSEPVTINGFLVAGQNASSFSLVQNYCQPIPYTLAAQSQCYLEIQFTPEAVGTRLANLEIIDSAPGSPQIVPMEGAGTGANISLSFNPSPDVFPPTTQGQSYYGYVYLQNLGPGTAQISLQTKGIDAADFSVTNYCSPLYPNGFCYVPVTFTPSALGIRVATLVATDSVSGQTQSVVLIGSGLPSGFALSASFPTFTPVLVGNASQGVFDVSNYSQSSVTITQFTLTGGAKSDFGILQNGCSIGTVLNQFSSCQVTVLFTPSAAGARIAEINIGYSGGSGPVSVPLAGTGLAPSRTITFSTSGNSSELAFGGQPLGVPVDGLASIVNTGTEAVTITGVSLAGVDAKDYAIVGNQCPQTPATLAPASNCPVSVQFTPSVLGTRLARLQVTDDASGNPQSLPVVGFGINGAPALQISPNTLSFNPEPLGSSFQQTVTLQTASGIPVSFSGVHIAGPNASDFTSANNCPATITSYCDVYVTFTPSVTGLRIAELQIQDNATGSPQIIPLAGLGTMLPPPAGAISLSPNPLTFMQAEGVGYTESTSLTVINTGTANVLLTDFHIGGRAAGDFGIQTNTCPLSPAPLVPNQPCYITIEFTPTTTGVRLATFKVTDNATGSPQSISIVGEGVAVVKSLQVTPTTVTFNATPVGTTDYNGGTVNIVNTGTVPVTLKSFAFSGANQGDFTIAYNACPSPTLNAGSSCQISLNFTPSAAGTRTAELTIESDATPAKQAVQLTGTGL